MNKDQVRGEIKKAAGRTQEKAGQVIGSTDQQNRGIARQQKGTTQKAVGDVKAFIRKTVKDVKNVGSK